MIDVPYLRLAPVGLVAWRAVLDEERMLRDELDAYQGYMAHVKHRLPGIW